MMIIGVDYHPSFQTIAFLMEETGECGEQELNHSEGQAEKFYRDLKQRGISVRVGMEATGYSRWFERLLAELGFEVWIGDPAEIKTKRVKKHKTDREDARLMRKLLLENRFPRIWVPDPENRDLRQLLWHRHRLVQSLFIQARGVLKKELIGHLRSKRRIRRSRHSRIFKDSRGQIVDAISIRERPAEIEDRAVPGHWEGDLIGGTKNSHIATLVERHSRFTALVKVRSKDKAAVVAALSRQIRRLPTSLRRSLTWDRGLEMAKHKTFTVATNVKVYFCHPHSPWQRGTNENTNRLLRQYLPKRTDLSGYAQSDLDKIALRLNQRPRKTLGFETPASKLHASVAPTS